MDEELMQSENIERYGSDSRGVLSSSIGALPGEVSLDDPNIITADIVSNLVESLDSQNVNHGFCYILCYRQGPDLLHNLPRGGRLGSFWSALHQGRRLAHDRLPPHQLRPRGCRRDEAPPEPRTEQRTSCYDLHHVLRCRRKHSRIRSSSCRKPCFLNNELN